MVRKLLNGVVLLGLSAMASVIASGQKTPEQPKPAKVKPATVFTLPGFQITSPNEEGWEIGVSNDEQVLLGKPGKKASSYVEARLQKVPHSSVEYIRSLVLPFTIPHRAQRTEGESSSGDIVQFKNVTCLRYQQSKRISGTSAYGWNHLNGYICEIPGSDEFIVRLEYSQRSIDDYSNLDDLNIRDAFFDSLTFKKPD